jgi:flagellar assembly protein FliH
LSKSRIMKHDSTSQQFDSYSLKTVTTNQYSSSSSYGETIGGNGSEIEREAYIRGFSTGEQAGKDQGLKEIEAQYHFLTEMIEKLKSVEKDLVKRALSDILQVSLAVAKQIIRGEIQQKPETLQEFIREATEKMSQSDSFLIRLHPVDKATLAKSGATVLREIEKMKSVRIEADPKLQPGECIIETHANMVDGRFESQLALFGEAFNQSMDGN